MPDTRILDQTDRQILGLIQSNARLPNAEVARKLEMATSAIHTRVKKLEDRGVVIRYEARLDPRRLGLGLLAFVLVRADIADEEVAVAAELARRPGVQEVHHVAGEDGVLVKVRARDPQQLYDLVLTRIGAIEGVSTTRTIVVFKTVKETSTISVESLSA